MRRIPTLSLLGLLLVAAARPATAQDRTWTVSLVADAGAILPIRTLGKNAGVLQERPDEQVISKMEEAMTFGGGVEVDLPARNLRFRAMYHTTRGGEVVGRLAFCGDPGSPLVTGGVCQDVRADATMHSLSLDMAFMRSGAGSLIRPVVFIGGGLRKYDFGNLQCPFPADWVYATCPLLYDLWVEEGGFTPVLRFGLGFDVNAGPLQFRTSFQDNVSRYPGGVGDADGHTQNDVTLTAGLSVKVF